MVFAVSCLMSAGRFANIHTPSVFVHVLVPSFRRYFLSPPPLATHFFVVMQVPLENWFSYGGERSGRFEGMKNKDGSEKTECGIHSK